MRCRKARGFESRLRYMGKDRYEFKNPTEGDWNSYEISVRDVPGGKVRTFDTERWEIHQVITVIRKPEPIKVGQQWWDDRVEFETESVEIVGIVEHNFVCYVAFLDYTGGSHLLEASEFRRDFHRELNS